MVRGVPAIPLFRSLWVLAGDALPTASGCRATQPPLPKPLHRRGRNLEGQCGVSSTRPVLAGPEAVQGLGHAESGVPHLSAGKSHSAAVLGNGEVWTWGDGTAAKLGHGTSDPCASPHRVESLVHRARVGSAALGGPSLAQESCRRLDCPRSAANL